VLVSLFAGSLGYTVAARGRTHEPRGMTFRLWQVHLAAQNLTAVACVSVWQDVVDLRVCVYAALLQQALASNARRTNRHQKFESCALLPTPLTKKTVQL
jgi:hypothetical protein